MRVAAPDTTTIAPGMQIARAVDHRQGGVPVDVVAGRILRTGVTDISAAGWDLIRATHDQLGGGGRAAWGTVAFVRSGDAWTAVELLTRTPTRTEALWTPWDLSDVRVADGVAIDAIWQVSHYGGDYTNHADEWRSARA